MIIRAGIPPQDRTAAADLYWQAFSTKLNFALGPQDKAKAFIIRVMRADHAITAHDAAGQLLGVVGFKTLQGALIGGEFSDLRAIYGIFGAAWRSALLSLLERDTENERFLMDGIFVHQKARGMGVGTALLDAICAEARARNYSAVRLDVIDTNPRARALYARLGFVPIKTTSIGPLRYIFGFRSSTTMVKSI